MAGFEKQKPDEVSLPLNSPPKPVEQPKAGKKETETNKEAALETNVSSVVPQDPSADKEDTRMEIVLASLPILAKGDFKGVDQGSSKAAAQ